MNLNYGFKQIAPKLGNYHPDHVRKLIGNLVKSGKLELRHWLGPKSRMIMDDEEIEVTREMIRNIRKHPPITGQ